MPAQVTEMFELDGTWQAVAGPGQFEVANTMSTGQLIYRARGLTPPAEDVTGFPVASNHHQSEGIAMNVPVGEVAYLKGPAGQFVSVYRETMPA